MALFEFEKKTQFFSLLISIQLSSKAGFIRSMIKYMDKLKKEINKSKKKNLYAIPRIGLVFDLV